MMIEEALTESTLDEAIQFVRECNPFAQQTWGWDTGRFTDWRWGSNILRAADNPNWFGDACRIFRDGDKIRALAVSEYGAAAQCVITLEEDREAASLVLGLLVERHQERGIGIAVEFSNSAEWLRDICRDLGMNEETETGCEWEYDLASVDTDFSLPEGFTIDSLSDSPDADRGALAECIVLAFDTPRDLEGVLRNIEANPLFRPELTVFARSPEGVVAAYCRGTVDPVSGVCGIDPICTHPEYQKLGLGKAAVRTMFSRQRALGGTFSYVGSAPPPAPETSLYRSLGPNGMSLACEWSTKP